MKEKIKIICLILITISIFVFAVAYSFNTLINVGCSSPKLCSVKQDKTGLERLISRKFLGIKCFFGIMNFKFNKISKKHKTE